MAIRVRQFTRIDAPQDIVLRHFEDVEAWPQWIRTFRRAEWVEGEPWKDGARLRLTMGVGLATLGADVTITDSNLPHSVAWTGRRFGVTTLHTLTFSTSDGGTLLTSDEVFDGPAPQLLGVTGFRPLISLLTDSWLDGIQAAAEAAARGEQGAPEP